MTSFLAVPQVLTPDELAHVQHTLQATRAAGQWLDGKQTAGSPSVAQIKRNWELSPESADRDRLEALVRSAILRHPLVQSYGFPRHLFSLIFSHYEPGMAYGSHVDAPTMEVIEPGGAVTVRRTDLSFTLFLVPPESYEGGELIVETLTGAVGVKLAAGDLVLYPASTLHRVETVTRGDRLAAVGWIQSQLRDPAQRELLYDLGRAYRGVKGHLSESLETQLLLKSYANLLRAWTEV